MKIVHVEDFFHPDAGYQINLLAKYMAKCGHEVIIVTSQMDKMPNHLKTFFGKENIEQRDKFYMDQTNVKIIRAPIWKYFSGRVIYKREIFKMIDSLNPDVLYVHGNDTLIGIQYILRVNRIKYKLILDSHMLQMASENKFSKVFKWYYRNFITPIIVKNRLIVIRTQNDPYVESYLGIPLNQCPWISVGTDTLKFKADEQQRKQMRMKYGINDNEFVVLYAGKLDESKGGMLLAETCKQKIEDKFGQKITFAIIGNSEGEYGQTIEQIFEKSQNKVLRLPTQLYTELPSFYQMADIAVFAKQCSLSFYDVQSCGLPVVFEDNNVNLARIQQKNGVAFKKMSLADFRSKIEYFAQMDENNLKRYSRNAVNYIKRNYDYYDITQKYLEIINTQLNS
ncbi:glycosyltransferase [Aminipila sp.]|jgi:glycosyltransferase involved in cell wall biosynthesis|uniref:glycosyltransferase n=1 Tax=Aminipila sp. TaxID=2060095 RepID=UPI001D73A4E8|nr:glycosyltransferase [Aminipila sp.]MBE6034888.1 glycosyltransferase family 4 protein [Clostridiales bacterium]